ncbi:MAG: DUF2807 domain-containing protein [Bacteroidales bacterium]|nr:DUF2807 domain-containing protein [Bacteroidales bacterium]
MRNNLLKLFACTVTLCFAAFVSPAQTKQSSHDFSAFDALEVDYDFNVRVVRSNKYSISLNVDNLLKDYIQAYVKNHTLHLTLDDKSLPSDVKKQFRGRRASAPVLDATIYLPESLSSVKMSGASVISIEDDLECREFVLDLAENAKVARLIVDADNVNITMAGKSTADLVVYADNVKVNAAGNSVLELEQDSQKLEIVGGGSSQIDAEGETLDAILTVSGSSKTSLKGKTNNLNVTGSGTSFVDAVNFKTSDCTAKLSNSSKLYEAATEMIHIDLSGNSTLVFDGDPTIDIINVKSSTVQRYSNVRK